MITAVYQIEAVDAAVTLCGSFLCKEKARVMPVAGGSCCALADKKAILQCAVLPVCFFNPSAMKSDQGIIAVWKIDHHTHQLTDQKGLFVVISQDNAPGDYIGTYINRIIHQQRYFIYRVLHYYLNRLAIRAFSI